MPVCERSGSFCFQSLRIQADIPEMDSRLEAWWTEQRMRRPLKERGDLDSLIIFVCWSIWKNRNAWVFGNIDKQFTATQLDRKSVV